MIEGWYSFLHNFCNIILCYEKNIEWSKPGSGTSGVYGPDYLVAEDVVLVTVNYRYFGIDSYQKRSSLLTQSCFHRLGPLGFLSLGNDTIFGNQVCSNADASCLPQPHHTYMLYSGDVGLEACLALRSGKHWPSWGRSGEGNHHFYNHHHHRHHHHQH